MQIDAPNAELHYGTFALRINSLLVGREASEEGCECVLRQSFTPAPRLSICATPLSDNLDAILRSLFDGTEERSHSLVLPGGGEIELINVAASKDAVSFHPTREPIQILPATDRLKTASFNCLNWPCFDRNGTALLQGGATLSLVADGWSVVVRPVHDASQRIKSLQATGGYVTTHEGAAKRVDGACFTTEELHDLILNLHMFFAFCLGARSGPCLTQGFDSEGSLRYLEAGVGQVFPGLIPKHSSWVDTNHPEEMEELFPLFLKAIAVEPWRKAVKDALYWYLSANRLGSGVHVDSALVFILTGLELLAWTTLVIGRGTVSKTKWGKLKTSEKVRQLMADLRIPAEIPASLPNLIAQAQRAGGDADLPFVLSSMRNDLVHPQAMHQVVDGAYFEAWRAGQWLVEMVLLALMDYGGSYGNRTRRRSVGQVGPVPWVES